MPTAKDFLLPDVGEGLTEADIVGWSVRPGDVVEVNQIIVEIETAKAVVELPSPYAGVVTAVHAQEGETLEVGRPLITIEVADDEPAVAHATATPPDPVTPTAAVEAPEEQTALLVGYGPRGSRPTRRRPPRATATAPERPATSPAPPAPRPAAKPPVRKLAKDLGVDLATVTPTGPGGVISREDVRRAARDDVEPPAGAEADGRTRGETRIPIRGLRKHTAAAMVTSAFTAPHVTEFITVDITETMRLREVIAARREFRGVRISPMLFMAKALMLALRRTPQLNAGWDEQAQEIVLKHYVHLGIAAATERGLVVPNIKDADLLSLRDLAGAIASLATTAREGRTTPQDMAGGTITLTNVGVFGVDTGTPIINPGEAAILAVGAVRRMPWVVEDHAGERVEPRWTTQLALSFDHRIADGQQGSQLLADIAAVLREPGLALL
ncbi:dihydrolipoamide acetyltransferase family protein [Streptomyces sparsogenes]|uniref:dihydrolipoamide acetyltransferase family protein n=1 Tax=Streptomyces sparsogenes TaxID=67365 RepID=UPI00340D4449